LPERGFSEEYQQVAMKRDESTSPIYLPFVHNSSPFSRDYGDIFVTASQQMPALFIIAGPLGAGKTTFYEAYLKEAFPTMVPGVREQQKPFLNERRSFAFEDIPVDTRLLVPTTRLSGRWLGWRRSAPNQAPLLR
jgi:hypothetical protein